MINLLLVVAVRTFAFMGGVAHRKKSKFFTAYSHLIPVIPSEA
jgi:hypothetical protein